VGVIVRVAKGRGLVFAVLARVLIALRVNGILAVAKELIVAKVVQKTWHTFTSVITLVTAGC